jgi:hypothetical protein
MPSMPPSSVTPNRTGVGIHRRCRIQPRRGIDRIFLNYHWRPRYDDRPTNHDGLGNKWGLLDNGRRRSRIFVPESFPLVPCNFAMAGYGQISGPC